MSDIHKDKGFDHDPKYSLWHRNKLPIITKKRDLYCSDIDWVEWRNGRPVALIECRRAIGSLKNADDVINHFKTLNNGFQLELYARLSSTLKINAFLVAIEDPYPDMEEYSSASFTVVHIIPPKDSQLQGRKFLDGIELKNLGVGDEEKYAGFLSKL